MKHTPLSEQQMQARIENARVYLEKRFPGLAFCLLVAQEAKVGTQNMHSTFNVPTYTMRAMLRNFALHQEKVEKQMNEPAGNA